MPVHPPPLQLPAKPLNDVHKQTPTDFQSSFLVNSIETKSTNFLNSTNQQTFVTEHLNQLNLDNNSSSFHYQQTWKSSSDLTKSNSFNNLNNFSNISPHKLNHHQLLLQQQQSTRESLDSRIEHLIKKPSFANSILGSLSDFSNSNLNSPSFDSNNKSSFNKIDNYNQRLNEHHRFKEASKDSFHSVYNSETILGTPPSPFLSTSDYIKWTKVTKAIDEGKNPSLSDLEENDYADDRASDEYSGDDDIFLKNNDKLTPTRRSFKRNKLNSKQNLSKKSSSKKYDDLDDDRMSLSSLSSGEKLELPDDSEKVSFNRKGFIPFTINSNDSVLKRNKPSYWSGKSNETIKINNQNQNFKFQISTTSSNFTTGSSFFDHQKHYHHSTRPLPNNKFQDVFEDHFDDKSSLDQEDSSKFKRSRMQNIKQSVIKIVVAELKGIIQRDINKKMIESTAYQIYENWWDNAEKQFKLKKEQKENQENLSNDKTSSLVNSTTNATITTNRSTSALKDEPAAWSVLSAVSYNKSNTNTNPFGAEQGGYQYGNLRAVMPKMPSFRRKQPRNEEHHHHHHYNHYNKKSDHYKHSEDDEFEKISSDDESFNLNEKKYVQKNRTSAIINNDEVDSLSDDSSSSSLSFTNKFQKRKSTSKHKKRSSSVESGKTSSVSSTSSSSASESNSDDEQESSAESSSEEEISSDSESLSSGRSNISSSSLESFDRKTPNKFKEIKSSSKKSSLLSSISQSSISSKSLSSYEDDHSDSTSSAYGSEQEKNVHETNNKLKKAEEQPELSKKQNKQQKITNEEQESKSSPKIEEEQDKKSEQIIPQLVEEEQVKPVKRKVGRPPKNKTLQQQQKVDKDAKTANKLNEKENVKPLKQKQQKNSKLNDNDAIMSREEIEASEALMALSGFFSSPAQSDTTTTATSKQFNENSTSISQPHLPQPKPVIILSEQRSKELEIEHKSMQYSDAETDSASETEMMINMSETPEQCIAIDHSYCIPRLDLLRSRSKYDVYDDISKVFDDDNQKETDSRMSDHLYSKASTNLTISDKKMKKTKQAAETKKGKKNNKIVAPVNDENVDISIEKPKEKKEIKFPLRTKEQEIETLYDFIRNGIDQEDLRYLKRSYDTLLQEDNTSYKWLNESHWSDHPPTKISQVVKKKKKTEDLRVHVTGCARTEGYYKMTDKEKAKSSLVVNAAHGADDEENENELDSAKVLRTRIPTTQQATREARSNQRRLLATVDVAWSDLLKFNQLQFRKKQLKFARSSIHDWGLFALEPIAADEMVIEYVGQGIRPIIADLREKQYNEMGIGSSYLFRVDLETIIDATKVGNLARFINHSCTVC